MSKVLLRDFPRTFWVANVIELFERGAYYGLQSVLAVYLAGEVATGGLGFDKPAVGFLQSIVFALTYVVPIVGGALADRYGYRRMLLVSLSLLSAGYFLAGQVRTYGLVFGFLLLMACGGGLFKPIISGTIARTTDERTSGRGFGVYYWVINVGAFVAPAVVGVLRRQSWSWVFMASALYVALMLLPALFAYTEPPRPASTKSLRDALMGAAEVLADARFVLMIVVYSGFWILYFQNFSTVLWYLEGFVDRAPVEHAVNGALATLHIGWRFSFDAELVTQFNAGSIILLQGLVTATAEKRRPLPTMITGMAIGALGFALLASSQSGWLFIAGLVVFSVGEMTAHPKFISLVGQVAPPDRKAVYMGYAFLYGVFGSLLGSNLGALAYKKVLEPTQGTAAAGRTALYFWGAFALLDLVAAAGLVLYDRSFGKDTPESRAGARKVMAVVYGLLGAVGATFLVLALREAPLNAKQLVQALLFVALGTGGIAMTVRSRGASNA